MNRMLLCRLLLLFLHCCVVKKLARNRCLMEAFVHAAQHFDAPSCLLTNRVALGFVCDEVACPALQEPLTRAASLSMPNTELYLVLLYVYRYQHLGSMMSLGATNAAVALPVELPEAISSTIASSPLGPLLDLAGVKVQKGLVVEGPLAQLLRRAAYLYRQPTNEQRLSVAASWLQQAVEVGAKLAGQRGGKSSGADRFT